MRSALKTIGSTKVKNKRHTYRDEISMKNKCKNVGVAMLVYVGGVGAVMLCRWLCWLCWCWSSIGQVRHYLDESLTFIIMWCTIHSDHDDSDDEDDESSTIVTTKECSNE